MTQTDGLTEEATLRPHPLYSSKRSHCCSSQGDGFSVIAACFSTVSVVITVALLVQVHYGNPEVFPHGAMASDVPQCSKIGHDVMLTGGTAADVAVAILTCLTVVHPHVVGPGGGGVVLVHDHLRQITEVLDFMSALPAYFNKNETPPQSAGDGRSIGAPGFFRGLEQLHKRHGKLSWADVIQPSVDLARNGFQVTPQLAQALSLYNITKPSDLTPFEKTFFPKGLPLQKGDHLVRAKYAKLLEDMIHFGAYNVYSGEYGVEVIEALRASGSPISVSDLDDYKVRIHAGLNLTLHNRTVWAAGAPFGGTQLLAALAMLNTAPKDPAKDPDQLYVAIVSALRSSASALKKLVGMEHEEELAKHTDALLHESKSGTLNTDPVPSGKPSAIAFSRQAVAQVAVIDTFDLYISAVGGLGTYFGSQVMTEHGILFNNHLAGNSHQINDVPADDHTSNGTKSPLPPPTELQEVLARPLTPYCPVIIVQPHEVCGLRVVLAAGQIDDALQVTSQLLFLSRNISAAIEAPRIIVNVRTMDIGTEDLREKQKKLNGFVRGIFNNMSQTLYGSHPPFTSVNAVSKFKDILHFYSDSRGLFH
ncbi:glutathione hydrolase 7-like [Oratosquilla oratoria]|uniref:glutathione hydrolase 7-like n=1 Tax=Oratosquilla oratoria TaxID=337810 RepID=UPI003F7648DB